MDDLSKWINDWITFSAAARQRLSDIHACEIESLDFQEAVRELWGVERAAGDSFKGGSIVVQALVEVTGKSVDAIKAFIDKKIEALKCSRQALYASFRADPKVGPVIERLEKEKAKPANVDTSGMLDEIGAA